MAYAFALEALYLSIAEQVKTDWGNETSVVVDWGERSYLKHNNIGKHGRICIVPGNDGGELGDIVQPEQYDHQDAEALFQQNEIFEIYVFGYDVTKSNENDFAQDHAVKVIWHELLRAIYLATNRAQPITSKVKLGKPRKHKPKMQHSHGKEWVCTGIIGQPILDIFDGHSIYTDVAPAIAHITTTHNGITDTSTTEFIP